MRVLSAGDVNGDGYGDLLVGGANVAELLPRRPHRREHDARGDAAAAGRHALDARWPIGNGDFNGDGHPDAVISGLNGGLLYDGDGQTLIAHPEVALPEKALGGLAGDFNGDGFADPGLLRDHDRTAPMDRHTSFQAIAGEYFYQGVGDVNGDGFSDVLSTVAAIVGCGKKVTGCTSAGKPPAPRPPARPSCPCWSPGISTARFRCYRYPPKRWARSGNAARKADWILAHLNCPERLYSNTIGSTTGIQATHRVTSPCFLPFGIWPCGRQHC